MGAGTKAGGKVMKHYIPPSKSERNFPVVPTCVLKTLDKQRFAVHFLVLPALMTLVLAIQSVCSGGNFLVFALPIIFFYCYLRKLYDVKVAKKRGLFWGFVIDQEIFFLNGHYEIAFSISMKKICAVKVCNLVFNLGHVSFFEPYICLLFDEDAERELNDTQGKGYYQRLHYSRGAISTEHYYLIAYAPETLEILKEHLDVPVIFEDEEQQQHTDTH